MNPNAIETAWPDPSVLRRFARELLARRTSPVRLGPVAWGACVEWLVECTGGSPEDVEIRVLGFGPGHVSPIHDHGGWTLEGLIEGTLIVERFRRRPLVRAGATVPDEVELLLEDSRTLVSGDVVETLPPDLDVHRVSNPDVRPAYALQIRSAVRQPPNHFEPFGISYRVRPAPPPANRATGPGD